MTGEIDIVIFVLAILGRVVELHFTGGGGRSDNGVVEGNSGDDFARNSLVYLVD